MPLPHLGPRSQILGRVYDAETGQGLADVLLFLGDATTLTDSHGRFRFPRPAPGTYYLHPDPLGIGLDRTVMQALPLEIQVGEASVAELDLAVIRSSRVSGRIEHARGRARPRSPCRPRRRDPGTFEL